MMMFVKSSPAFLKFEEPENHLPLRMNGKLSEQPPAELIREICQKSLSGTLRLQQDRAEAVVYFENGRVIFAASNLRNLRLREYLKKQGLVSEKELSALVTRSDPGLASALCANGKLDRRTVDALFATQVADVLRVALLWMEGRWDFNERTRFGDSVRAEPDLRDLMMEAARRLQPKLVSSRFRNPNELISPVAGLPNNISLSSTEGFVLSRVDIPTKLNELIAVSGLSELEAYRAIYVLALGGFLHREHWWSVFRYEQAQANNEDLEANIPAETVATEPVPAPRELPAKTEEQDLDEFFERLSNAANHYEVLDVTASAGDEQIKRSYYALARRFHPDRFQVKATSTEHARIESAFARVTQAYEILTNSAARLTYDAKLAAQEKSRKFAKSAPKSSKQPPAARAGQPKASIGNETNLQEAENYFEEGFAALQEDQTSMAISNLASAARLVPREPRYRAYYGRALAAHEQTRRLAEVELQEAIRLDPSNTSYRVMLAELYFELGFLRRAKTELERVLAADPSNASARTLLRKLGNRKAG
jgi:curved DNA-binding protein CbpA